MAFVLLLVKRIELFNNYIDRIEVEMTNIHSYFSTYSLDSGMKNLLYVRFSEYISDISSNDYKPNIILENNIPKDYAPVILKGHNDIIRFDNMSCLLEKFYSSLFFY